MNEGKEEDDLVFIGKTGLFCPIKEGRGGGLLLREKDGKYNAATGSKGYRWLESETVQLLGKEDDIDRGYFDSLCEQLKKDIYVFVDFDSFADTTKPFELLVPPWLPPCGRQDIEDCTDCEKFHWGGDSGTTAVCDKGIDLREYEDLLLPF
jgi:hypothetical protein